MEALGKITKKLSKVSTRTKPNRHLHSPAHLLAEELSVKFNDRRHFGLYLGMATRYHHDYLRKIMGEVLENKNIQTPGKLFSYLVKKNNLEAKK
jgi:hypothetical protein